MTGSVWVASYVALWAAVILLGLTVVALLRQVGVLHARLRPQGVHFAGEGPERLKPAPLPDRFNYQDAKTTLLMFSSSNCAICDALKPGLRSLTRQYPEVQLNRIDHDDANADVFSVFNVRSTPYFVAVDQKGIVKVRGVANTIEQVEVMLEESYLDTAAP
ncbi:MAG: thioredoxin domain-containing protein [Actinomycetota bacterium]